MQKTIFQIHFGISGVLAAIASFVVNKSIFWAFIHFFLGWFYMLYAAFMYPDELHHFLVKFFNL